MKVSNGGGSSLYVIVIWLAVLFGCLASSAQCRSQLLNKVVRTRGVFLAGTAGNTSAYHSEIECPSVVVDDDESKLKLIFCTVKCYCHGVHGDAICYCCQKPPGAVCHETLADCQADCPICNPECPPAPPAGTATEGQHLDATTNATSYL
ncbi:hypothetical protein SEVIR_1G097700v4 [Setaria viridis]|uniref:Embryo surrounding factor 1 brassicaceae domain-containing protein n=1 Tax=Setaria viridis TaxID=4556 RepID=A0A4U6W909_SETVI|nr:hypothetical protein SEVIR_1G097700v2 [Setaria viridis]